MRLILTRLKGHAKLWYNTRPEVVITWIATKEEIMQQFRKSVPFNKLLKDAALYETSRGQALGYCCFNKLNKLRKLDLVIPDILVIPEYLIDAVIGGITVASVARAVRSAQLDNASGLHVYMTSLDTSSSGSERKKETRRDDRRERSSKIWKHARDVDENVTPVDQLVGGGNGKLLL